MIFTSSMNTSTEAFITMLLFLSFLISISMICQASDTITTTQFITDNQTIVSSGGSFEMGFFSPGSSNNWYLGIWYKKITTRTVVWVANREISIMNPSGVIKIFNSGILVLLNKTTGKIIWSTNTSRSVQNPVAQLLESGNLVVKEANDDNPDNFLWQSFDYPCDTLLPGMKLGKNLVTGRDWYLSSWKSNDDPARGFYTYWLDLHGYPQLWGSNGSVEWYRYGPWNGQRFSGNPSLKQNNIYNFSFVFSKQEAYYIYELLNSSIVSRLLINKNGYVQRWTWVDGRGWVLYITGPTNTCDRYAMCGAYASCNIGNSPICGCLDKFVPRLPTEWAMGISSSGCVRRKALNCQNSDGFLKYSGIKLPDTRYSWFNESMTLKECQTACLHNCTCMAYAALNISSGEGSGCLLWLGDLIDIKEDFTGNGQDLYIRMASSELDPIRSTILDWPKRFHIINGIAQACLYLYQDSRLRITHRDLKVSNVLLDIVMNPKISDFGMARSFKGDETEANTNRVVGTYDYMSPKYAVDGYFSVKSDIFSFGVLVLEIMSGKRNKSGS